MSVIRPRRRRVPTVYTNGGASRQITNHPNESSRSIFALIDEYEDDVGDLPPPILPTHVQQNIAIPSVVNVQDSSDGEEMDHDSTRPGYCKICEMQRKKAMTEGEGSSQPVKETPIKCGICFSATSEGGTHHPHAMRCGHIFGKSCIDTWIGAKMPSTCPVCTQVSQDALLVHLYITSARDEMLEEALEKADEVVQLKEKHRAEKATLIGLNTMLFDMVKKYVNALAMGCGILPNP